MPEHATLIDAHVHLRNAQDPAAVLDGALNNFDTLATKLGAERGTCVLMLSESADEHGFERLAAAEKPIGRWIFESTGETTSLRCQRVDDRAIILIKGQQIATADGLEVLTLACSQRIDDGQPIRETLKQALDLDALVVLPWGFGKWTGKRKQLMLALVREFGPLGALLGDSAARPAGFGDGAIFGLANKLGIPILPGTDPLPIGSHETRAGKYGIWLQGGLNSRTPSADLRERLSRPLPRDAMIGRRDGIIGSIITQLRLRLGN
jgi:hypothetical protein